MREFKFRIWLPQHNQLIYPHLCDFIRAKDDYIIGQIIPYFKYEKGLSIDAQFVNYNFSKDQLGAVNDYYTDIEYIIQQYTGLKDSKGVEIYEGDIVQYNQNSNYDGTNFEVTWSDDSFGWVLKSNTGDYLTNMITPNGPRYNFLEAVGNIFENPELLEQTALA
jgi:uncharacterized phage protein (TIGR01671 family)